jgi:endonuclease III
MAFREKAVKTFLALKYLVEIARKKDENLKAIRLAWESFLPDTHKEGRPMAAAITMLCSGATNDKRLLPELKEHIFERVDYSAPNIVAKGKDWVCRLLQLCRLGKQNKCADYIYELAKLVVKNSGLERDYRRLKYQAGFGPKTALITIQAAYGLTQGIGVDVHVSRILGALEWSVYKSSMMVTHREEVIRVCAEAILSPQDWVSVNNVCGALGQLFRDEATSKRLLQFAQELAKDDTTEEFNTEDLVALRRIHFKYTMNRKRNN